MEDFKSLFVSYMKENMVEYSEYDEYTFVVTPSASNVPGGVQVLVVFDETESDIVHFVISNVATFTDEKRVAGMALSNRLNAGYRWAKFYLNDHGEMTVVDDAIIESRTVGSECIEVVRRLASIVDVIYPEVQKAVRE